MRVNHTTDKSQTQIFSDKSCLHEAVDCAFPTIVLTK